MHDKIYSFSKCKTNRTEIFLIAPTYTIKCNFIDQATPPFIIKQISVTTYE